MEESKKNPLNKALEFIDKNSNFILVAILVFALILRLKYLTINQAVWYDEAEYLSVAKNWAFNLTSYQLHYVRPPLLPFLMAGLYKIGFDELAMRVLILVFSMTGILFTYLVGREIFNKWVGLIATFIMSFFYLHLFSTARILTDMPSMTLWLMSSFFFWKGYIKKRSKKYLWLLGPLLVAGLLMRFPFGLLAIVILVYLLITEGIKFLKDKDLWIGAGLGIISIVPYTIWYYITYSKIILLGPAGFYGHFSQLKEYVQMFPIIFQSPIPGIITLSPYFGNFFILLLFIGIGVILFNLITGYDMIKRNESLKNYLFILFWLIAPFIFFAFFAGQIAEDRYLFYLYPAAFFLIGIVLIKIYEFIKKTNRVLALSVILLILISASVTQISYADRIIKIKSTSYIQFREAGNWIKENSSPGDKIIAAGEPQLNYYSERDVIYWPEDYEINEFIEKNKEVKYIILSVLEQSSQWTYTWPQENQDKVIPVKAYSDSQQRPILVIYEVKR